jgi:hypothetical protein
MCSKDKYKEITSTQEFKEMGIFPESSSVKIIDEVMVIKFTNNP